jgi:hypothetical protein
MGLVGLRRRQPARSVRPPIGDGVLALALVLATFGLYGVTMGQLTGYEPETAGATEGLVQSGAPRFQTTTAIAQGQGLTLRGGYRYSHTGITQPVLEAPFYFLGEKIDDAASGGKNETWRVALLRLYNPAMAAITVLAMFLLLRLRGRSQRQALAVASLGALASMIWPYSKIGMETTMMAMVALMLLGAAWASARGGARRYALAGLAAGAAAAAKPVGLVLLIGVLAFSEPLLIMPRRQRIQMLIAFAIPLLAWIAAIAWYNAYRTGSITNFDAAYGADLLGAPFAAIGMLISPGKGLVLYSPLVILGALGLRTLWQADRPLALAIALTFLANLIVIAGSSQWSEDAWGPRYIVASAWLLLLPIAWWVQGRPRRHRVLAAVATLAVVAQLAGVFAWYGVSLRAATSFTGQHVYLYGGASTSAAVYGDDGPTWIPRVSELLFQTELLAAWVKEKLTGSGFTVSYQPFLGRPGTADLRHPQQYTGRPLPDFWWNYPGQTTALDVLAVGLAVLGLCGCVTLARFAATRPVRAQSLPSGPQVRTISSS